MLNDHIYALLGLADDIEHLPVNYTKDLQILALDLALIYSTKIPYTVIDQSMYENMQARRQIYKPFHGFPSQVWQMLRVLDCSFERSCFEFHISREATAFEVHELLPSTKTSHSPQQQSVSKVHPHDSHEGMFMTESEVTINDHICLHRWLSRDDPYAVLESDAPISVYLERLDHTTVLVERLDGLGPDYYNVPEIWTLRHRSRPSR